MNVLNFFRKIIYYKCAETPSELAKRQQKALKEEFTRAFTKYERGLIKCPFCGSSKIYPPITLDYLCLHCGKKFFDPNPDDLDRPNTL